MSNETDALVNTWSIDGRVHRQDLRVAQPSVWSRLWGAVSGRRRVRSADLSTYRRLALQLHSDLTRGQLPRSVVVATAVPSLVGAQASTALACCLAAELMRPVLLVDGFRHDPEVSRTGGTERQAGLSELLADAALNVREFTRPTSTAHLWVLPAGRAELAGSASAGRVAALVAALQREFDFIVLSTGSILDDPLPRALAPEVGSVLLVAVDGETRTEDLDAAANVLTASKARHIGLVLATPVRVLR